MGYLHLFTSIELLFRSSQHMVTILHFCSLSIISGQFMFKWGHLWSNLNFWQPETAADLHCLAILLDNFKTADFFLFIQRHYGACLCFCNMEFGGHDIQRPTTSSCSFSLRFWVAWLFTTNSPIINLSHTPGVNSYIRHKYQQDSKETLIHSYRGDAS